MNNSGRLLNALNLAPFGTGDIHTRVSALENNMRILQLRPSAGERVQDRRIATLEEDPVVSDIGEPPHHRRRLEPPVLIAVEPLPVPEPVDPVNLVPAEMQALLRLGLIEVVDAAPAPPPHFPVANFPRNWNTLRAANPWPWTWHPNEFWHKYMRMSRLQQGGFCQEACITGNNAAYTQWFDEPVPETDKRFAFIQMGQFLPCARCSDASTATRAITWTWCRGPLRSLPVRRFAQRPMDS